MAVFSPSSQIHALLNICIASRIIPFSCRHENPVDTAVEPAKGERKDRPGLVFVSSPPRFVTLRIAEEIMLKNIPMIGAIVILEKRRRKHVKSMINMIGTGSNMNHNPAAASQT